MKWLLNVLSNVKFIFKEGQWIGSNNEKLTWDIWAEGEPKNKSTDQDCGLLDPKKDQDTNKMVGFLASYCNFPTISVCEFKTRARFQLRKTFKCDI